MSGLKKISPSQFIKSSQPEGSLASYPAMPLVQNNHKFYLATIPAEDLFPYCFVTRRMEEPTEGFQRTLNEDRAIDIARYLDNSLGSIPTNIVLSSQPESELAYDSKKKLLRFRRRPKSFLVIDGQHRLFGYGLTKKHHRVPVAIYEGLDQKNEAAIFIDVNTNQRGVPAALLLDIKHIADMEKGAETSLRKLFDRLNTDSESVLNGKLSPSISAANKISRVTFNRAVKDVISNPVLQNLSEDKSYTLISNYFKALAQNLKQPDLLYKSAYFEAFCSLFEDVVRLAHAKFSNTKLSSLVEVLNPLSNIQLGEVLASGGKTKITKTSIIPVLRAAVTNRLDITDDQV